MVFFQVLWAEALKVRRTMALRMAALTPAVLIALMIFAAASAPFGFLLGQRIDPWLALVQRVLAVWTLLALPLFITLEAALMAGLEHAENQWKNLFALPVPRWTVYVSKLAVVTAILTGATALLFLLVVPAGKFLSLIEPTLPFDTPIPWGAFLQSAAEVTVLSFLAVAIQHSISVRWRSFPVAVGIGLLATVTGFLVTAATARDGPEWARYFPWSLQAIMTVMRPASLTPFLLFSGVVGFMVAAAGCWDFCRRDVK